MLFGLPIEGYRNVYTDPIDQRKLANVFMFGAWSSDFVNANVEGVEVGWFGLRSEEQSGNQYLFQVFWEWTLVGGGLFLPGVIFGMGGPLY